MHVRAVCILSVLLLTGCSRLAVLKEIGPDFPGISKHLSVSRPLHVLIVHGMGRHQPSYADALLAALTHHVGLRNQGCRSVLDPIRHPDPLYRQIRYGTVMRCDYRGRGGQRVDAFVLTWAPLTAPLKERYLSYDRTDKTITEDRLRVNAAIKESLIDESLADAILYVGSFRDHMQYPIQQALCVMMRGHSIQEGVCTLPDSFAGATGFEQIVVVASSLGSTMVFQTIEALHAQTHALTPDRSKDSFARAAEKFAADTATIFMLANQLPLLRLGDVHAPVVSALPPSVERFVTLRHEERSRNRSALRESLQIVAFSDPNDLLSYAIPQSFIDELPGGLQDKVLLTNVILSVAEVGAFKSLADPLEAHTGYDRNPTVLKFISCGTRTQATC